MDREEYTYNKKEMMRRRTFPYYMHNELLAKEFYAELIKEVPTAQLYTFPGTDIRIGFQAITHDQRAEKKLWEQIKGMEIEISKTVMALMDLREVIDKSIKTGETKLPKKQKGGDVVG